jgi:hypothetical protein
MHISLQAVQILWSVHAHMVRTCIYFELVVHFGTLTQASQVPQRAFFRCFRAAMIHLHMYARALHKSSACRRTKRHAYKPIRTRTHRHTRHRMIICTCASGGAHAYIRIHMDTRTIKYCNMGLPYYHHLKSLFEFASFLFPPSPCPCIIPEKSQDTTDDFLSSSSSLHLEHSQLFFDGLLTCS